MELRLKIFSQRTFKLEGIAFQNIMIKTLALCLGEFKEEGVDGCVEANHGLRSDASDLKESNRLFVSKMILPAVMNNKCCHCSQPLELPGLIRQITEILRTQIIHYFSYYHNSHIQSFPKP